MFLYYHVIHHHSHYIKRFFFIQREKERAEAMVYVVQLMAYFQNRKPLVATFFTILFFFLSYTTMNHVLNEPNIGVYIHRQWLKKRATDCA